MVEDYQMPKPEVRTAGQFVRDLSFQNVLAQSGGGDHTQPSVDVQVSVDARKLQGEHRFQSSIKLNISSKAHGTDKTLFLLDVDYVGVFEVKNIPEDQLEAVLMIECPRLLFPFMRRVIGDMIRDGGFPPLNLEHIDFGEIYRKQAAGNQVTQ